MKSLLFKMKGPVTNQKPIFSGTVGGQTIQGYENGKLTIGIKTGKKPGPHFGGSGTFNGQPKSV
jgi:hypothetical protein